MATGPTKASRAALVGRAFQSGFTLLEILVVVAIIGIFIGIVTLSTDLVSFDRQIEREARRLESLMRLASEEALLQSQDLGLQIHTDGYSFLVFNHATQTWQAMAADDLWETHLFDRVELELKVEDREVELETHEAFQSDWLRRREEEKDEDDEANGRTRDDERDGRVEPQPPPPIVLFSSGELTPFELEFRDGGDPFEPGYVFTAEFDGTIEIDRSEL